MDHVSKGKHAWARSVVAACLSTYHRVLVLHGLNALAEPGGPQCTIASGCCVRGLECCETVSKQGCGRWSASGEKPMEWWKAGVERPWTRSATSARARAAAATHRRKIWRKERCFACALRSSSAECCGYSMVIGLLPMEYTSASSSQLPAEALRQGKKRQLRRSPNTDLTDLHAGYYPQNSASLLRRANPFQSASSCAFTAVLLTFAFTKYNPS